MVVLAILVGLILILVMAGMFMIIVEEIPNFLKVWRSLFGSKEESGT
jgi:hypothetical protein